MPGLCAQDLFGLQQREARKRLPHVPACAVGALCWCMVKDATFELDHVQPYSYVGEASEKQWLCAARNYNKSNKLQAVRR